MSSPDRAHANGSAAGEDAAGPAAFTRREILGGRAADQQDKGHPLTFRPSDAERNVVHPVPSAMIADYRHADPGAHIAARTDEEIATTLREFIGERTYRQIALDTGFNAESVRRYLLGRGRIPAVFVAAVSKVYGIDPVPLLLHCDRPAAFRHYPSSQPAERFTESMMRSLWPKLVEWFNENTEAR